MIVGGQPELAVLAEPFCPFWVPVLAVLCWQDPQCDAAARSARAECRWRAHVTKEQIFGTYWQDKAPKRDGCHGSPCPVLAIFTSLKRGHRHDKDSCNSGSGLR